MAIAAPYKVQAGDQVALPIFGTHPELGRAVYDAQIFENLQLYCKPESFQSEELEQHFVPVREGGEAAKQVIAAVRRQLDGGFRYGPESKLDVFEVLRSSINPVDATGNVKVRESWYLPTYRNDGSRVAEKRAYFHHDIEYMLRKMRGTWLIQSTTTPYAAAVKRRDCLWALLQFTASSVLQMMSLRRGESTQRADGAFNHQVFEGGR